MRMVNSAFRAAIVAGAVAGLSAAASADVSRTIFSLTATNSLGTETFSFELPEGADPFVNGIFDWIAQNPIVLDNGIEIRAASVHLQADPIVAVSFAVNNTAGEDSAIMVSSPLLSFATINDAVGNVSASVTLNDPHGDGASLTPIAGKGYTAFYNGGVPQAGTEFASLFGAPITLAPHPIGLPQVTGATMDFPGENVFLPMGAVTDASASWSFVLSDGDLASGSSTFEIVPTPGTGALIALGAATLLRRRRR